MIFRIAIVLTSFYLINSAPEDYQKWIDNLRVEYYNHELAAPNVSFAYFKYNRTQFAINVSIWILQDIDGRLIEHSTKLYAFLSNTFKYTGVELKVPNVCKMWEDNLYGIRTTMTRCGNVDLCNIKKGLWHLGNCWPVESFKYWPKSVPQGSYKVTMEERMKDGTPLVKLAWYGRTSLLYKEMQRNSKQP